MLQNDLLVPVAPNFPIEQMSKELLNVCLACFHKSSRKKDGTYYIVTFINEVHGRVAIDRFLCSLPHNKPY